MGRVAGLVGPFATRSSPAATTVRCVRQFVRTEATPRLVRGSRHQDERWRAASTCIPARTPEPRGTCRGPERQLDARRDEVFAGQATPRRASTPRRPPRMRVPRPPGLCTQITHREPPRKQSRHGAHLRGRRQSGPSHGQTRRRRARLVCPTLMTSRRGSGRAVRRYASRQA